MTAFELARAAFFILWLAGTPALLLLAIFLGIRDGGDHK